jgi:hypothetical protein
MLCEIFQGILDMTTANHCAAVTEKGMEKCWYFQELVGAGQQVMLNDRNMPDSGGPARNRSDY